MGLLVCLAIFWFRVCLFRVGSPEEGLRELAFIAFPAGDAVLAQRERGDGRADEMLPSDEITRQRN